MVNTTANNDADDEIKILTPPKGALIDKSRSFFVVETAPAGTVTADVGTTADKDVLCDGANLASQGKVNFNVVTGAGGADLVEVTSDDDHLVLTLKTMTTPAAGKIRVCICYYVR